MTIGYCDNCTEITINGISRDNNEIVYKNVGDDVKLLANAGICYAEELGVLRFNGSNTSNRNYAGSCSPNGSSYNCNNLSTNDTGVYLMHVTLDDILGNSEWCTNNVTMIIQCKERYLM